MILLEIDIPLSATDLNAAKSNDGHRNRAFTFSHLILGLQSTIFPKKNYNSWLVKRFLGFIN
jgi:hypothetical protein